MKLLVTGFGPFGNILENPSATLAEKSGCSFKILEVSFAQVDEFVDEGLRDFDGLLAIGVNAAASRFNIETVAVNEIGLTPDFRGEVRGPGPIDPRLPHNLAATLWPTEILANAEDWDISTSAGTYLCNYLFYQAVSRFENRKVGFLHIPTFERLGSQVQLDLLQKVLRAF